MPGFEIKKCESSNKTVRMPNDLIEKLHKIAESKNVSFSQVIIQCCIYALDNITEEHKA